MEQFAARNRSDLRVVGIGTQDSLTFAENFHELMSPRSTILLWDQTGAAWRNLGVFGQPSWMLLNENGEPIVRLRFGRINEELVLRQIS